MIKIARHHNHCANHGDNRQASRLWLLGLAALSLTTGLPHGRTALAQDAPPGSIAPGAPGAEDTAAPDAVARGQALLEAGNPQSVEVLRNAAQESLKNLLAVTGPDLLTTPVEQIPLSGKSSVLLRKASRAHYWWGMAAESYGRREEAIMALGRAARFAGPMRPGNNLARDAFVALGGALREGLPRLASDDTLDAIASIAHGHLWKPEKFTFEMPKAAFGPALAQNPGAATTRVATTRLGASDLAALFPKAGGRAQATVQSQEFLITSGKLFPPVAATASDPVTKLWRIPPFYQSVPLDRLPPVMQMSNQITGYARETDGPNRGLWHQVVRVFYSSQFLTKNRRDDRPRAEALCLQFLKVHALTSAGLGLENPYTFDGVTTLWLAETSSWWPWDDEDPRVQEALGVRMPKVNTPIHKGELPEPDVIESRPIEAPWRAAGQVESAWGEIMFFKASQPRDDFEWLRELSHEYGHVALPPVDGFSAPLEPYGNGTIGETLSALWAAAAPAEFSLKADAAQPGTVPGAPAALAAPVEGLMEHVNRNAVSAIHFWNAQGPASPLSRSDDAEGLRYLQGLAVYVERVYGSRLLGAAFKPLVQKAVPVPGAGSRPSLPGPGVPGSLDTVSLLEALDTTLRDPFESGQTTLPIWLPGAIEAPSFKQSTSEFVNRAALRLRASERATAWLYVPPAASRLRLEWQDVAARRAGAPASAVRVDGWKTTPATPTLPGATGAALLEVKGRAGWQQFVFAPSADLSLTAASFERVAP